MKQGEGTSQRTYMKDPWTGTMVRGLTTDMGDGLGGRDEGEKWDICNSRNNKTSRNKRSLRHTGWKSLPKKKAMPCD